MNVWPAGELRVHCRPEDRAADWLVDLLSCRAGALRAWEPLARVDAPDAVHKMRVTVRQLRSDLRTFAPLVETGWSAPVRAELGWLAAVLGSVRDAEVLRARLTGLLDALDPSLVRDDAAGRLTAALADRHLSARDAFTAESVGGRYAAVLASIDALPGSVLVVCGTASIAQAARPCVADAFARLSRRCDRALKAPRPEHSARLHEARRAAKRARYGAEALAVSYGEPAVALAGRAEALQDALGEVQDAHVSQRFLLGLATEEIVAGHDSTTLGLLAGLEEAAARRAGESFGALSAQVARKRHRRWLTA